LKKNAGPDPIGFVQNLFFVLIFVLYSFFIKQTTMKTAKWIAGIFFLLVALGSLLTKEYLEAVLLAIAGLFCLPPSLAFLERALQFKFPSWQKYAIVLICMVLAFLYNSMR
jgi:hypothetical protein